MTVTTTTMLAAVHLAPALGVPLAVIGVAALGWFHRRLAGPEVPAPRRRVRRAATMAMVGGVLALLVAISFADPAVQPTLYVASWTAVVALLLVIVALALVDIGVSSWLIRMEHDEVAMRRGAAVLAALEAEAERRAAMGEPADEDDAEHHADAGADEHGAGGPRMPGNDGR